MSALQPEAAYLIEREISRVLVQYARALDERDWPALQNCFTENALGNYGAEFPALKGRAQIVALCRRMLQPLDASQHLIGTVQINVQSAAAALSQCYFQAQHVRHAAEGGALYIIAGTYRDQFLCEAGRWKIARRELIPTWAQGNPAVIAAAVE